MKNEDSEGGNSSFYSTLIRLRDRLRDRGDRLVLAESCTSGLVAAELGKIPGISSFFCGSMVVYRTQTKSDWLEIPASLLEDPSMGPVSREATSSLASAMLRNTPEATVAAAVTGHLGPGAPKGMDGQIFYAVEFRASDRPNKQEQFKLTTAAVSGEEDLAGRSARQVEATRRMFDFLASSL